MRFKTTLELDVDVEFSTEASEPDVGYVGGVTLERIKLPGGLMMEPTDLPEDVQASLREAITEYLVENEAERANDEAERRREAELDAYYDLEMHLRDRGDR